MIEMVYKGKDKDGKDERRLPKNVRQIGEAGKGKKVYLEDYVVTYLHQVEAAVLLGETGQFRWMTRNSARISGNRCIGMPGNTLRTVKYLDGQCR